MKNKLRKLVILCSVMATLVILLSACNASPEETTLFPIEIQDQLGRVIKLDKVPQRIVSLAPSNTEIIFALGLADSLAAVTDYCNYPSEAEGKPSIGGFSTPNVEEIIALSPDLILATSIHEDTVIPQLEEWGMTVFALNPKTTYEVLEAITMVGEITGKTIEASDLVTNMQTRIKAITDIVSNLDEQEKPRVFYFVWHDPLMPAGSGTLQDDLIANAGGINCARQLTGYDSINLEAVIQMDPEVMIAGVSMGSGREQTFQYIKDEPRLRDTSARLNDSIYAMDMDVSGRPGPRIVEALEKFAEFMHPQIFKEAQ